LLSKRHTELLKILGNEGTIAIADLAARFDVTLETIRRDLKPLADSGRIVKMHGAVCLPGEMAEAPFQKRMRENADAKRLIGKRAASTIKDGDSLMLDTGTTTSFVARELLAHRRLTVITNSTDIARTLASINGNKVFMAGGELRADSGASFGASAVAFLGQFHVKHAIISAGAIDAATGIMDFDIDEAEIAKTMLSCADRRIVVSDHTKFNKRGLISVCPLSAIEDFIVDQKPSVGLTSAIQSSGGKINCADNEALQKFV
jgi:DeoR family transcriptional regulator, glycerol-3-phosphate regulon repressor